MRILPAVNPRIPGEGSSAQGKPGPKPRPEGVGDGQLVDIPVPPLDAWIEGMTQRAKQSVRLEEYVQARIGDR